MISGKTKIALSGNYYFFTFFQWTPFLLAVVSRSFRRLAAYTRLCRRVVYVKKSHFPHVAYARGGRRETRIPIGPRTPPVARRWRRPKTVDATVDAFSSDRRRRARARVVIMLLIFYASYARSARRVHATYTPCIFVNILNFLICAFYKG